MHSLAAPVVVAAEEAVAMAAVTAADNPVTAVVETVAQAPHLAVVAAEVSIAAEPQAVALVAIAVEEIPAAASVETAAAAWVAETTMVAALIAAAECSLARNNRRLNHVLSSRLQHLVHNSQLPLLVHSNRLLSLNVLSNLNNRNVLHKVLKPANLVALKVQAECNVRNNVVKSAAVNTNAAVNKCVINALNARTISAAIAIVA